MSSLKISEVSKYIFTKHYFQVEVHLINNLTQQLVYEENTSITINLFQTDQNILSNQFLIVNNGESSHDNLVIPNTGTLSIPIMINTTSMVNKDSSFYLEVSKNSQKQNKVKTNDFLVVRHQLIVHEIASPWYKDLGGKDQAIELKVTLIDCYFEPVKLRRVPLTLLLYYESGILVQNQSILKVLSNSVIGDTGEANIRVRIEEVSRSHQKQRFLIQISPNIERDPRYNDISPVFTTPVDVMSKPKSGVNFTPETGNGKGTTSRKKSRGKSETNDEQELSQPPNKKLNNILSETIDSNNFNNFNNLNNSTISTIPIISLHSSNSSNLSHSSNLNDVKNTTFNYVDFDIDKVISEVDNLKKMNQEIAAQFNSYELRTESLLNYLQHFRSMVTTRLANSQNVIASNESKVSDQRNEENQSQDDNFSHISPPPLEAVHSLNNMQRLSTIEAIKTLEFDDDDED